MMFQTIISVLFASLFLIPVNGLTNGLATTNPPVADQAQRFDKNHDRQKSTPTIANEGGLHQSVIAGNSQSLENEKVLQDRVWLLAEVIAAGNKTNHALQSLEHHADLLAVFYGIAAGILVFGGVLAGWIGFGRLQEIKPDVIQTIQPQLDSMRRDTDRGLVDVQRMVSAYGDAEKRLSVVAKKMSDRFDELDKEENLKARGRECTHLSIVVRALKPLGETSESVRQETEPMLTDMLEKMIEVANSGIQLVADKSSRWWMVFRILRGAALKDLGNYQAALNEAEQILANTELEDTHKSAAYYNAACYASLLNRDDKVFSYLERAIYLNLKYKSKSRTEPDFKEFWKDPRFIRLIA